MEEKVGEGHRQDDKFSTIEIHCTPYTDTEKETATC